MLFWTTRSSNSHDDLDLDETFFWQLREEDGNVLIPLATFRDPVTFRSISEEPVLVGRRLQKETFLEETTALQETRRKDLTVVSGRYDHPATSRQIRLSVRFSLQSTMSRQQWHLSYSPAGQSSASITAGGHVSPDNFITRKVLRM
jgi:hypothetical protein